MIGKHRIKPLNAGVWLRMLSLLYESCKAKRGGKRWERQGGESEADLLSVKT
jgi:hypothetical protein